MPTLFPQQKRVKKATKKKKNTGIGDPHCTTRLSESQAVCRFRYSQLNGLQFCKVPPRLFLFREGHWVVQVAHIYIFLINRSALAPSQIRPSCHCRIGGLLSQRTLGQSSSKLQDPNFDHDPKFFAFYLLENWVSKKKGNENSRVTEQTNGSWRGVWALQ
ncbi:uncharacterized protein BJX67DRAFT_162144 [Aspergillus lucknowensis]|uniref:Uncharacterized protein n=1 Tax=Aspergillus lucknowensis TaxID=176173 RepID=A0ABR4M4F2_9EURO